MNSRKAFPASALERSGYTRTKPSATKTCAQTLPFADFTLENMVSEYSLQLRRRRFRNSTTSVRYLRLKGRTACLTPSCVVAFSVSLAVFSPMFQSLARFVGLTWECLFPAVYDPEYLASTWMDLMRYSNVDDGHNAAEILPKTRSISEM